MPTSGTPPNADAPDRAPAGESLLEAQAETDQLLRILPAAVWRAHDRNCAVISGNAFAESLLKVAPGTNMSLHATGPGRPPDWHFQFRQEGRLLDEAELPLQRAIAGRRELSGLEISVHFTEGRIVHLFGSAAPLFDRHHDVRGAVAVFLDVTDLKNTERELRVQKDRLDLILESASDYAIITLDGAANITSWNTGAERMLGYAEAEVIGRPGALFFTPEDRAAGQPELEIRRAREDGRAENERWHLRKDGSTFWGSGLLMPLASAGGDGFVKIFRDRTAAHLAGEKQRLLLNELKHRVMNTLATVQSIAAQTLRGTTDMDAAREALFARLVALSRAHNVLTGASWQSARLDELVRQLVSPHDDGTRFLLQGPPVTIPPASALVLGMALHELCTNSAKYGALSVHRGRVVVRWNEVAGGTGLQLCWVETGGPRVAPPRRRGFGSRLLEQSLARELGGEVRMEFAPEGVRCTIRMPVGSGEPQ